MNFFDSLIQYIRIRKFRLKGCLGDHSVLYASCKIYDFSATDSKIKIGKYTHVRGELLVLAHGGNIEIGDYCYIGEGVKIWSGLNVRIGDRVLIAHNVSIIDNNSHPIDSHERHEHYKQIITTGHPQRIDLHERKITICDDAWIGCMCVILPGVTIGQGAIVGAGSVVTKDVIPYSVVGGNPARLLYMIEMPSSQGGQ